MSLQCPIPINEYPTVQLAHGGGGKLMNELIEKMFITSFDNAALAKRHDGAVFPVTEGRLAFTTDSYVVQPLFFPGGDIGTLAVNGTVNDLAMCGARPTFLSAGFILEEGLPMETLWRVVTSMRETAEVTGIKLITGDTKVVDRGKGDGLYINTTGIGLIDHDQVIGPASVNPGDAILLSGDLGRHGMAVMAQREGLAFETTIESDCAPLTDVVTALLSADITLHCLRDLTRGGLTSALVEIAETADVNIHVNARMIPVREDVRGGCEILGLDPLYVANEGRMIVIVPAEEKDHALNVIKSVPVSSEAVCIGYVTEEKDRLVTLESEIGVTRILDMLSGEQLPRIC